MVFVDSTSSCDPDNHSITFMLCPCSAGAVPVAIIITKGQTEESYRKGFELLNEALIKPFNGRGHPAIFMTDDSEAEIKALRNVWPASRNLLCIFHVSQAVWRWLWDSKHEIPKEHRSMLMVIFQRILYASTVQKAEEAYKNSSGYVGFYLPTYENWNEYLDSYWKRKELWCLAFRNENVRGHNTNNFSEVCVRIFKDQVLCRVKAYNVLTLLDFVSTHLEKHYTKKLRDFANGRSASSRLFMLSLKKKTSAITKDAIKMQYDGTFLVRSDANLYIVDAKNGCCSCSVGLYGRFCKHQYSIYSHFDVTSRNFPPVLPRDKYEMSILALGEKSPPKEFFEPLISEISPTCRIQEMPQLHQMNFFQLLKSMEIMA
ncbi:hypothetical protein AVEN_29656-1 [Araneus ventricosus]|uniref:SWIM-type domain-containing protein n=1 Tax=Araneus ventricosus TaxID=182803 RepID=A0A4Y2R378_ARAVE|nr:hypothetical protein AVEN_29656-1 [Araneus ventricosus]